MVLPEGPIDLESTVVSHAHLFVSHSQMFLALLGFWSISHDETIRLILRH